MDLLEYQAKMLFREVGIPVLPSECIDASRAIKQLQIPYPIVLKSQVRAGGRGRVGGVRFVENTIDAIAAAQSILDLRIGGEYPQVILAEARYDAQQELFLAIVLDYELQRPVLLGSAIGGLETANREDAVQTVLVDGDFSPFYARRLALQMGVERSLLQPLGTVVEKMYRLFVSKDLNSIEINPLGIGSNGEVMALDGKIAANDCALGRHLDLQALVQQVPVETPPVADLKLPAQIASAVQWYDWGATAGEVAIVTNRLGLGMATWDLLCQRQGKPAGCLVVDLAVPAAAEVLATALARLAERPVAAIALNLLVEPEIARAAALAIAGYLQPQANNVTVAGGEDRINRPTAVALRALRPRPARSTAAPAQRPRLTLVLRLGSATTHQALRTEFEHLDLHWADSSEALAATAASLSTRATQSRR